MSEQEALRAYFDAHMAMRAAIDADKFAAAYVNANKARDCLLQIEQDSRLKFQQIADEER